MDVVYMVEGHPRGRRWFVSPRVKLPARLARHEIRSDKYDLNSLLKLICNGAPSQSM